MPCARRADVIDPYWKTQSPGVLALDKQSLPLEPKPFNQRRRKHRDRINQVCTFPKRKPAEAIDLPTTLRIEGDGDALFERPFAVRARWRFISRVQPNDQFDKWMIGCCTGEKLL